MKRAGRWRQEGAGRMEMLSVEDVEQLVQEETLSLASPGQGSKLSTPPTAISPHPQDGAPQTSSSEPSSAQRYLALCSTLHKGLEEFFDEVAKGFRERDERGFPNARQASVMRLTYLRAENDACEALYQEVRREGSSGSEKPLQQARLLALVKMASLVISRTLSTCSFLLSEETAIDRLLVNKALIFFAKLSTLFGNAGNPSMDTRVIANFVGLKSLSTH